MFDPETQAFLESGCGLLVATVSADGEPHATRGWGLDVARRSVRRLALRLLLDADDERTLEHVADGGAVAITAANVADAALHAAQGASAGPRRRQPRATRSGSTATSRDFHADVEVTDDVPWETFERFFPGGYVACIVERRTSVRPDTRSRAPGRGRDRR